MSERTLTTGWLLYGSFCAALIAWLVWESVPGEFHFKKGGTKAYAQRRPRPAPRSPKGRPQQPADTACRRGGWPATSPLRANT